MCFDRIHFVMHVGSKSALKSLRVSDGDNANVAQRKHAMNRLYYCVYCARIFRACWKPEGLRDRSGQHRHRPQALGSYFILR